VIVPDLGRPCPLLQLGSTISIDLATLDGRIHHDVPSA